MAESRDKTSVAQRYEALLGVLDSIATQRGLASVIHDLEAKLRKLFGFDFFCIILFDPTAKAARILMLESARGANLREGQEFPVDQASGSIRVETQRPFVVHDLNAETRFPVILDEVRKLGSRSYYEFPLTSRGKTLGMLAVGHVSPSAYSEDEIEFWCRVANQIAIVVDNAIEFEELEAFRNGNVREVENVVERAAIISRGPEFDVPPSKIGSGAGSWAAPVIASDVLSLEDAEREQILSVLRQTEWVVGGPTGAAARLGMKRTTLQGKMRRLGISRI